LLRYLEECDEATIDEAALVAVCLAALPETAIETRRCLFGPWPKERLVHGGVGAFLSLGPGRGNVLGVRLATRRFQA
jgi:hypothetical protein